MNKLYHAMTEAGILCYGRDERTDHIWTNVQGGDLHMTMFLIVCSMHQVPTMDRDLPTDTVILFNLTLWNMRVKMIPEDKERYNTLEKRLRSVIEKEEMLTRSQTLTGPESLN